MIAASFALMGLWVTLPVLVVGVVLMDLGVQAFQVAAQARVLALLPNAGSRLNTLYMVGRFVGGAAGSVLGAWVWTAWGWSGVCLLAIALSAAAGLVHARDVAVARAAARASA